MIGRGINSSQKAAAFPFLCRTFLCLFLSLITCAAQPLTLNDPGALSSVTRTLVPPLWLFTATNGVIGEGSIAASNTGPVYLWTDKMGNSGDLAIQSGSYPTYSTTNGPFGTNPCVEFNVPGFNYLLGGNTGTKAQPFTVFALLRITDQTTASGIWGCNVPGNVGLTIATNTSGTLKTTTSISLPPMNDTNWVMYSMCLDGANSWIRTNGVQYATGGSASTGLNYLLVGNDGGLANVLLGRIAEFYFHNRRLSTNVIAETETLIRSHFGM